ncbi:MAG TPA: TIGR02300 family protein [Acetobacteraceae bacterium]|nr:TIGR02300 family protein [Acetobacteraceae bacterium]
MVKPELGNKRICVACGTRFYDLGRSPAVCPKCHTEQPAEQPRLRRPPGPPADEKRIRKPQPAPEEAGIEIEETPEGEDEDVMEDTSDLGDDPDETLGGDIEVSPGSDDQES